MNIFVPPTSKSQLLCLDPVRFSSCLPANIDQLKIVEIPRLSSGVEDSQVENNSRIEKPMTKLN